MNPIIGISCFCNLGKKNTKETPYYRIGRHYIEPIIKCGGTPFIIPEFIDEDLTEKILSSIDGLIISGGSGGIDKGDRIEVRGRPRTLRGQNKNRYIADSLLIKTALRKNMPLMGMCRGMQMICEVTGGKLNYKFLDEIDTGNIVHRQKCKGKIPTHMIELKEGSMLQKILGVSKIKVNSLHSQFCTKTGEKFEISAWAKNKITEAIESPAYRFALGLQFHPEEMCDEYPEFLKIFETFIEKCQEYKGFKENK